MRIEKTPPSMKDMVAKNPNANERGIRKALRILVSVGGPATKRKTAAIPYAKPMHPVEFTGEEEPRRVRLSGRR